MKKSILGDIDLLNLFKEGVEVDEESVEEIMMLEVMMIVIHEALHCTISDTLIE